MKKHRLIFDVAAVAIIAILIPLFLYIVVITQDIPVSCPISIFNWNPSPEENTIPIILPYPDATTVSLPGTNFGVTFMLDYKGTLGENTPIQIVNASCISYLPDTSLKVSVGFSQAINMEDKHIVTSGAGIIGWGGAWCVTFEDSNVPQNFSDNVVVDIHLISPKEEKEIYFPVAGDYSPIILVSRQGQDTVQYTYSQVKVHVLPASEVEAERISRLNLGLTFAFLGFAMIGGILGVYELIGKQEKSAQTIVIINDLVGEQEITSQSSEQKITKTTPQISKQKSQINNTSKTALNNDQPDSTSGDMERNASNQTKTNNTKAPDISDKPKS